MLIRTLKQFGKLLPQALPCDGPITGFSVDTQTLLPGNIYFALPGAKVDGHAYVDEAFQKGAIAAVVNKDYVRTQHSKGVHNKNLIAVDDVLMTMQDITKKLFEAHRPRHVIAVTGSLGKTTTKDFLTALLSTKFKCFKTPGNNNSKIGLPLGILNHFEGDEEAAVIEMGMTHPGEITFLTHLIPPDFALITKVALVHAVNFQSIQEIGQAKSEIFAHPLTKLGIYADEISAIYPVESVGNCVKKRFSLHHRDADYFLEEQNGLLTFFANGKAYELGAAFTIAGEHNRHNLLAALAIAAEVGLTEGEMIRAIPSLSLPDKRLQRIEKRGVIFINDSYNANADSTVAAMKTLPPPHTGGKKIGVLGGMTELGAHSIAAHQRVGNEALETFDELFCFGPECRPIIEVWQKAGREVREMPDHRAIAEKLRAIAAPGDVVLLKGSKSKTMWKVLEEF